MTMMIAPVMRKRMVKRRIAWVDMLMGTASLRYCRSGATSLVAAAPAYAREDSQGEFVFDHGWADALERAGGRYYPKLQIAVPFTPATGRRFLGPEEYRETLWQAAIGVTAQNRLSSLHDANDVKVFDKVIVITDRVILDRQLQDTIFQFEHAHGVVVKIDQSSQQLADALAYVETLGRQTETATEYPARLNTNCSYCDHRKQCPAYADALKGKREFIVEDLADLEGVAREREEVARLAKALYARKEELEDILKAQLKERDELVLGGVRYRMFATTSLDYPLEPTLSLLADATGLSRDEVLGKLNNRCVIAIISDFFADLEQIRAALARVKHAGHDLIAFQILDKAETEFRFRDALPFEGLSRRRVARWWREPLRHRFLCWWLRPLARATNWSTMESLDLFSIRILRKISQRKCLGCFACRSMNEIKWVAQRNHGWMSLGLNDLRRAWSRQ